MNHKYYLYETALTKAAKMLVREIYNDGELYRVKIIKIFKNKYELYKEGESIGICKSQAKPVNPKIITLLYE